MRDLYNDMFKLYDRKDIIEHVKIYLSIYEGEGLEKGSPVYNTEFPVFIKETMKDEDK